MDKCRPFEASYQMWASHKVDPQGPPAIALKNLEQTLRVDEIMRSSTIPILRQDATKLAVTLGELKKAKLELEYAIRGYERTLQIQKELKPKNIEDAKILEESIQKNKVKLEHALKLASTHQGLFLQLVEEIDVFEQGLAVFERAFSKAAIVLSTGTWLCVEPIDRSEILLKLQERNLPEEQGESIKYFLFGTLSEEPSERMRKEDAEKQYEVLLAQL